MANNFLEQLVAEWYEYRGYFVRRNVPVGRRARGGGYQAELDVVAFNPATRHLVHIEPSMDAESWETRERRFRNKFDAGREHIPELFPGLEVPDDIEQIAILFGSKANHPTLGGGQVVVVSDLMREIMEELSDKRLSENAVPEHHTLLRTLQLVVEYRKKVFATLR